MTRAKTAAQNTPSPIVVDLTMNQAVYDTHQIHKDLLKWRIQVGQELQVVLPILRVGDTWKIRAIQEPSERRWSPVRESDVIDAGSAAELHTIEAQREPVAGPLEYPGLSFTFVGRKPGKAVVKLVKSNSIYYCGGPTTYDLELTVSSG